MQTFTVVMMLLLSLLCGCFGHSQRNVVEHSEQGLVCVLIAKDQCIGFLAPITAIGDKYIFCEEGASYAKWFTEEEHLAYLLTYAGVNPETVIAPNLSGREWASQITILNQAAIASIMNRHPSPRPHLPVWQRQMNERVEKSSVEYFELLYYRLALTDESSGTGLLLPSYPNVNNLVSIDYHPLSYVRDSEFIPNWRDLRSKQQEYNKLGIAIRVMTGHGHDNWAFLENFENTDR